jgi:type I restriction enzyme S subunit
MNEPWPRVKLGELLSQVKDIVIINDDAIYKQVTVRMHNKGLVTRKECTGKEIKTKKQYRVRVGQFVISRIDARNGAMGLVPIELDNAIVSNDFPVFNINIQKLDPSFFNYFASTETFTTDCRAKSKGTSNRQRLKEEDFFEIEVPLPQIEEQRKIVERIDSIKNRVVEINILQSTTEQRIGSVIHSLIDSVAKQSERMTMKVIAPLVRRKVVIDFEKEYPELGIRSFGKGTFHKPAILGDELNGKRLFRIEPGDLLLSNVFAWEGAVAVAQPEDVGRYGSHRFISRKSKEGVVSTDFLYYYFTTPEGIEQLGKASPGSAGRNRTLGLQMLDEIEVPVPDYKKQLWIVSVAKRLEELGKRQEAIRKESEGLFKSVLDKAFQGEL